MKAYYFMHNKTKNMIVYNNCGDWKITDEIYVLGGVYNCLQLYNDENSNIMIDNL